MDLELAGRCAIVTGASRGIGLAIAHALAGEGVKVALVARGEQRLTQAADQVATRHGVEVLPVATDTRVDAALRAMVESVAARLGVVGILVNAAAEPGAGPGADLADLTDDAMRAELETKVLGYLRCARAVAPQMVEAGWGRIINVGGLAVRRTGSLVGSFRNAAVVSMTQNLADELGPAGVTVTVAHPGMTLTERTEQMIAERVSRDRISRALVVKAMASGTSIGRLVSAAEVADVVTFLASPRSTGITGDAVSVGGGTRGTIHY